LPTTSESNTLERLRAAGPYYSMRLWFPSYSSELTRVAARLNLSDSAVRLRGWDFPHFDDRDEVFTPRYVGCTLDWERHLEIWRLYLTGQFVYLGSLWDASDSLQPRLRAELDRTIRIPERHSSPIIGAVSLIGMIYSITEFCLFSQRLGSALGSASQANLQVALLHAEGWALVTGDDNASSLHRLYQSQVDEIRLPLPPRTFFIDVESALEAARGALVELFGCFGWLNADGAIAHWQRQFVSGGWNR